MGNNESMTAFEATVIRLYDIGALTPEVLDAVAEPYRDTDIDMGGYYGLETHDGKEMMQVIVETIRPGYVPEPDPADPESGPDWYSAYSDIADTRWRFR